MIEIKLSKRAKRRWDVWLTGQAPGCTSTLLEVLKDDAGSCIFLYRQVGKNPKEHDYYQTCAVGDEGPTDVFGLLSINGNNPKDSAIGFPIDEDDEAYYRSKIMEYMNK